MSKREVRMPSQLDARSGSMNPQDAVSESGSRKARAQPTRYTQAVQRLQEPKRPDEPVPENEGPRQCGISAEP